MLAAGIAQTYEPPKPLPVEIKAGEIVAWRCWIDAGNGKLRSMTRDVSWKKGKPIKGDVASGVGVHAWKTRAQAENYARDVGCGSTVAVGTVELWGQVIEHDEGYRAQFGELKEVVGWVRSAGPGTPPHLTLADPSFQYLNSISPYVLTVLLVAGIIATVGSIFH